MEKPVAGFFDNLGARVIIFVNPVTESHQALAAVLILGGGDKPGAVVAVPFHIKEGDLIKVDTRDSKYVEKANK